MPGYQDVLISAIGDFGRGQLLIVLVCILLKFTGPWFLFTVGYISYEPDWWKVTRVFNESRHISLSRLLFSVISYSAVQNFL